MFTKNSFPKSILFRVFFVFALAAMAAVPIACGGGGGGGGGGSDLPDKVTGPNPSDGATGVSVIVTLGWTLDNEVTEYHVLFGTSSSPDCVSIVTTNFYDPSSSLAYSTTYYWRVDAENAEGVTVGNEWTFVTEAEPTSPPIAVTNPSPADNAIDVALDTNLGWDASNGATGYYVFFGSSSPPTFVNTITTNSYDPGTLAYSTEYFWKVIAYNSHGNASATEYSFTTVAQSVPATVTAPSPADASENVSVVTDTDWAEVADANSYYVYFGTSSPPSYVGTETDNSYNLGTLEYSTTYYWKVLSCNAAGNATVATEWYFVTESAPISAPLAVIGPDPSDGDTSVSITVDISWNASTSSLGYFVFFGTSSPPTFVDNVSSTTYDPGTLEYSTTYYWKVLAYNTAGNASTATEWDFVTEAQPLPGKVTNASPDNGATAVSVFADFSWNAASYADSYVVYFGESTSLGASECKGEITTTTYDPGIMKAGKTYYWRVDTVNAVGTTTGDVYSFTTVGVARVVAGYLCSYVILDDGTGLSWGDGEYKKRGDNSASDTVVPGQMLIDNLVDIKVKYRTAFATLGNGSIACWGGNYYGELGMGLTTTFCSPMIFTSLTDISEFDVATYHATAVLENGSVYVWGRNNYGQLGEGGFITESDEPILVNGISGAIDVVCGYYHTIVKTSDGRFYGWGRDNRGQLGLGTTSSMVTSATYLPHFDNAVKMWTGAETTFVQFDNGEVYGCGYSNNGELAYGSTSQKTSPYHITALDNISEMYTGSTAMFGLCGNGAYICWGGSERGAIGKGDRSDTLVPILLTTLTNISQVAPCYSHTMFLLDNGDVFATGDNDLGQIGMEDSEYTDFISDPVTLTGMAGAVGYAGGNYHGFILSGVGTIKGWGANEEGNLGLSDYSDRYTPTVISGLPTISKMVCAQEGSLALLDNGSILSWGYNNRGCLGFSGSVSVGETKLVEGIGPNLVVDIWHESLTGFAKLDNGSMIGWGYNTQGELGINSSSTYYEPVILTTLESMNVTDVATSYNSTLFLLDNGSVLSTGYNNQGQLGDNTTDSRNYVDLVQGLTGMIVIDVEMTTGGCFAILDNGSVMSWGNNHMGNLGLGDTDERLLPELIPELSGVEKIGTCEWSALAVCSDGSVFVWGANFEGCLGLGDTSYRTSPVENVDYQDAVDCFGMYSSLFVVLSDGTVKGAGLNSYGQLTNSVYTCKQMPVKVTSICD